MLRCSDEVRKVQRVFIQDALYKSQFLPAVEKYFPIYERRIRTSPSGFISSSGLTWIDFLVAEWLNGLHTIHPDVVGRYPELVMYCHRVKTKLKGANPTNGNLYGYRMSGD